MSAALVWFRRDLRTHDHPALSAAVREYDHVVPVFVFDPVLLHGRFSSSPRSDFMLGCLRALDDELRRLGAALVVRAGVAEQELIALARQAGAGAVLWTSDVSPYARMRDARVTEALRQAGLEPRPHGGNYVVDVSKPRTTQGDAYSVFSPFFRAWRDAPRRPVYRAPRALAPLPQAIDVGTLPAAATQLGLRSAGQVCAPITAPGEPAARIAARRWLAGPLERYAQRQDSVAERGTSVLSPYLRWGCLSASELERRAARKGPAATSWTRQLAWRDFYAHVLLAWPENARLEFQPRFRALEWDDAPDRVSAWQQGETGYPLVDAGMRQLQATGWMHNRVRLVVGSFLTKDLHLDWRQGERWFERLLLDGEPAQNNGNWQWIASVGTDPAPAFRRMYNPTLQARRLDPDGRYIRRWVPELARVPSAGLFEPWTLSRAQQRAVACMIGRDYPAPIVDHRRERQRPLERYGAASGPQRPRA